MQTLSALIAGVTGAVGRALARELASSGEWRILGLSRTPPANPVTGVRYLQIDLQDRARCIRTLAPESHITHLFYCGRVTHADQTLESAADSLLLLETVLDSVERVSAMLRHVHFVQGGKYYGVHLGPFPTPAREDQPRCVVENFYYDQEDLLRHRSKRAHWSWSASRPNTLLHYSPEIARNLVSTLGALAAIRRESGAALDFPGPPGAYTSLTQFTTIEVLARAMVWMATESRCRDQAFNVTNTDLIRWNTLWPRLAQVFGAPLGSVRPSRLTDAMADKEALWQRICACHRLRPTSLDQVANWAFADATLERDWDEILSHNKARQYGFVDGDDSEERFMAVLEQYRRARILP